MDLYDIDDLVFIVAFAVALTPSRVLVCFSHSYVTEGDNRIPKIYTKTGDKGFSFKWCKVSNSSCG